MFKSDQEWREYQLQHDPEGYERWKKDQERWRLAELKEENYGQWAAASRSDQLREELLSLESRRIALEREKPELIGHAGWPFQGPLGKQYAEVIHYIEILKAELIRRGEALDTAEGKNAADSTREAFMKPAAGRDQKQDNAEQQPELAPKSWQELEIAFLSDERVEICCGGTSRKTYNYAELGFQDRRNEKPNRAWVMLREIARKTGTMPQPSPGTGRAMIQKRMEEIREKLRGHFGIETDSIPFNGSSYQTSFKISCRASFDK